MTIRQVYLESRGLEPPAVLLLPTGSASAEKALVYSGGLKRAELQAWLESRALKEPSASIHGKVSDTL